MFIDTQRLQKHLELVEDAIPRVMYFDTLHANTIWNKTAERYLCGHCRKEKSVGIYPSVVFYFHVRRETEGAGGGKHQTFLLFAV
jgi:alpha-L-fucosidase